MASFRIFSQDDILSLVNKRDGETKLGEKVDHYGRYEISNADAISLNSLKQSPANFVLLGIPEDIGVRANFGIGGTQSAWTPALKSLLNLQENQFLKGEDILVLGEFDIPDDNSTDVNRLRNTVAVIDDVVFPVIKAIVASGKIPIVIGGGHNNCYPIIKGTSLALKEKINVLNIDAHTDLRNPNEGRHSGNGFSTAIKNGLLNQYFIFGLHQNYLSDAQLHLISTNDNIKAVYYDDLLHPGKDVAVEAKEALNGLNMPLGLEIDLDSISDTLSSAATPSGFNLDQLRSIIITANKPLHYLHICEGAYELADGRRNELIGKTIAYLVSDFIKRQKLL